ncbi:MAG: PAS domain-containing protein [Firmicutes bacterium]|nr:PAS domain-containing protein [Bacillota bacterium]
MPWPVLKLRPVLKLKYQLVLVMTILVLTPMLSSALVVSNLVRNQNEKNARQRISDVANKLAYSLTTLETEYLAKVKAFATTEEVVYSTYVLFQYGDVFSDRTKLNIVQPLRNSLLFYKASLEADTIDLIDAKGRMLASVGPGDDIETLRDLEEKSSKDIFRIPSGLPLKAPFTMPREAGVRFQTQGTNLLLIAEAPITHKSRTVGAVIFRKSFDSNFATEMAKTTGTDLAFFTAGKYVMGTLPPFTIPAEILADARNKSGLITTQLCIDNNPYNLAVYPLQRGRPRSPMIVVGISNVDTIQNTRQTVRAIFLVAFLGIIISTIFTYIWAGNVTEPINMLVKSTKKVAAGKLDEQIETGRRDELGELATQFNMMTRSLKQNTDELSYLKELNQNIVESIAVGLLVIDSSARVLTTNAALERRFNLRKDSLIGKDVSSLFGPDEDARFKDILLEIARAPGHREINDVSRKIGDEVQIYNIEASPLRDRFGKISGKIILIDDVTERAQLVEQLIRSEKLASVGKLAAGLAHEINNPLGTIINYVQTLLLDEDDAEAREYLRSVETETRRISHIVRDLLNFARQSPPHYDAVDIHNVLDESLRLVEYQHLPETITIIRKYYDSPLTALGDANQLKQAFLNLAINAFQAMQHGGTLVVTTSLSEDEDHRKVCHIAFSDTGTGIPDEHLRYIFDPFFTTKEVGQGTGLGLFVTFGIVQAHGGTINVNTRVGHGTTFTIILPVIQ